MGIKLGDFGYLSTTRKIQYKGVHYLCALCGVLCKFIFTLKTQLMQVAYALDEPWLFDYRKNPKTPDLSHMLG